VDEGMRVDQGLPQDVRFRSDFGKISSSDYNAILLFNLKHYEWKKLFIPCELLDDSTI